MPPYAGFAHLAAYLNERCRRDNISHSALSEALNFPRNYIHTIAHGQFSPSRTRADAIAKHFGDDPHVVRILAGLESPPPDPTNRQLREIADLAASLDPAGRAAAIDYLKYLLSKRQA